MPYPRGLPKIRIPGVCSAQQLATGGSRSHPPRPRSFTQKSSLLLVARTTSRPQLPFLHPITQSSSAQASIGRFISTERKQRWKASLFQQLKFHAWLWPTLLFLGLLATGVQHTKLEKDYPTPREWTFWSRWTMRLAKYTEQDEGAKIHRVLVDWSKSAQLYKHLLSRLESEKYDGKFLLEQGDGGILVEGVGKTGFDIGAKSEQWRRGYHDALMGAARVAEHLDGMCKKIGEEGGRIYSWENIPGPNNPRPKPLPWDKRMGQETPPNAHEVENAFPAPEVFYMKVLTTRGFDNRQRLEAALGYADWCDFKGLPDTARSMYDWALDIAASGVPGGVTDVVDPKTGIINKGKEEWVTENILSTTTALAVHHARAGEVKQALPIFLSVLRARKSLPPSPYGATGAPRKIERRDALWDYIVALQDLVIERPFPPAPPTGDERPFHTLKEACEEVGLMTYVGEILFATSESEREKGLSWTRDSVEAAEAVMWVMDEQKEDDGRERCRQCLETGLQNWKDMAQQMLRLAANKEKAAEQSSGWLGLGLGKNSQVERAHNDLKRWEEESTLIELRRQKTLPLTQPLKQVPGGWFSAKP